MLERAAHDEALVHLFDEPQLNTQDGYIGFMLRFFQKAAASATGCCSSACTRRSAGSST